MMLLRLPQEQVLQKAETEKRSPHLERLTEKERSMDLLLATKPQQPDGT